jgi:hypothetical protein
VLTLRMMEPSRGGSQAPSMDCLLGNRNFLDFKDASH